MKLKNYLLVAFLLSSSISAHARNEEPAFKALAIQSISNNTPYRLLSSKDNQGWNLETDDGTIWRAIDNSSASQIKYWQSNDKLVIYPTAYPKWSGGRYYLLNTRLNSAATVELSQAPITGTSTNIQITYIDYTSGYMELEDGRGRVVNWRLNRNERDIYEHWRAGQSILVGSNENCWAGWLSSDSYILINVEKDNYVRANID